MELKIPSWSVHEWSSPDAVFDHSSPLSSSHSLVVPGSGPTWPDRTWHVTLACSFELLPAEAGTWSATRWWMFEWWGECTHQATWQDHHGRFGTRDLQQRRGKLRLAVLDARETLSRTWLINEVFSCRLAIWSARPVASYRLRTGRWGNV